MGSLILPSTMLSVCRSLHYSLRSAGRTPLSKSQTWPDLSQCTGSQGKINLVSERAESTARDVAIAEAIPRFGIAPGDRVASIGDGQEAYWAHLARVSVVAEVWSIDSARFWSEPLALQQAVLRSMADSGAKAVVWRGDSDQLCPPQWLSLPEHSGCMISLH
jgi:hypothetical protein